MYYILPLTNDPRQVMTMDLTIDGEGFHARIEVRYLPAPGCWVISVWDEAAGELLINQIPCIAHCLAMWSALIRTPRPPAFSRR